MTLDEVLRELEAGPYPTVAAMREAMRQAPAILPAVISAIDAVAGGTLPVPRQEHLLSNGMAALAAARQTDLYRPVLRLYRVPLRTLEFVLGDLASEWLTRIVISTFDGDPDPLINRLFDREIDGFLRWGLMSALARLAFDGRIPRRQAIETIDRFEAERAAGSGDVAWMGWANMILMLGLRDHADRVRTAWNDGRIDETKAELDDWLSRLDEAVAAPDDPAPFEADRAMAIDDPMDMIGEPPDAFGDEDDDGDDEPDDSVDPTEAFDLTPAEEGWLSLFLKGIATAPEGIGLEQVDGFMSGLANGPSPPASLECIRLVRTVAGLTDDAFASEEQRDYCLELLARLWLAIETRARHGMPHHPCIVALDVENAGRDWARGFRMAVQLNQDAWTPLIRDEEFARLLTAVLALEEESLDAVFGQGQVPSRAELIESMPLIAIGIGGFWNERRESDGRPIRSAKVGRNVPCPCGSGRKFKYCCGKS